MICEACGSDDTETYPREHASEPDVLHCHACGHDQQIQR